MIVAVFVTFNPEVSVLEASVKSLIDQVDHIVIVDNSHSCCFFFEDSRITIEALGRNLGIAAAQNFGIRLAIMSGADYVLLSDQDTIYPVNYLVNMLPVFSEFSDVCAVVPRFSDSIKKSDDGFIAIKPFYFKKFFPDEGKHEIFQAIASGKIIRVSSLSEIGLMEERLFIDWVDLEWCWRARKRGFKIIGNAEVWIWHSLGDASVDLGFREVNLRSATRHYYITRNAFYLALYCHDLDFGHRINIFFKSFLYIFCFPILSTPRKNHLKAVLLGFFHGVSARLGVYKL